MSERTVGAESWCDAIGHLVADALVDAGVIRIEDLESAKSVIAEELFARLSVEDYPPRLDIQPKGE
jgi:hypothetical protein